MPYDIVCEQCDFHKVEHRLDAARDQQSSHAEEQTGHEVAVEEFRMNGSRGTNPVHR